jgi:hypothetical protein
VNGLIAAAGHARPGWGLSDTLALAAGVPLVVLAGWWRVRREHRRRVTVPGRRGDLTAYCARVADLAAEHGHRLPGWAARPGGYRYARQCAGLQAGGEGGRT